MAGLVWTDGRTGARCRGFTLVELLTVLAIIGLLVAILVPSTTTARTTARRVKTKVQFGQWTLAMEQFRQEYGYYPAIDGGTGRVAPEYFAGALTGRALDGISPATAEHLAGNSGALRFYDISEDELNGDRTQLCDGFGNTDIAVIYDKNGDDLVGSADGEVIAVRGQGSDQALLPESDDLNLATGVRGGVLFYSAGRGVTRGDLVFSWK